MITYGLSGEDIIKQIHRAFYDLDIPDGEKIRLIDRTGEIEFRIVEGSNERIQLEALLAYLALVGERTDAVGQPFYISSIFPRRRS